MKKKNLIWGISILLILAAVATVYYWGRPAPVEMRQELYPCVVYYRRVHYVPRMMVAHIVTVDLTCKNINTLVTPPEKGTKTDPLRARTTSQFSREFNVQVAINGDGFTPWRSNSLFDYYPHVGDPITPNGFAASRGKDYGEVEGPTLFVNSSREASFGAANGNLYNAI
jgi:hypothetical protein